MKRVKNQLLTFLVCVVLFLVMIPVAHAHPDALWLPQMLIGLVGVVALIWGIVRLAISRRAADTS